MLLAEIYYVSHDIQGLLTHLAAEVSSRRASVGLHYQIDTKGDLIPALPGINSLEKIKGVWDMLRQRLLRGENFAPKYLLEARGGI